MLETHLSIVIPAYNEADNFATGVLNKINNYLRRQPYESEVIIVDDGSTDGSPELLQSYIRTKPNWQLIKNPHLGKAQTVGTGIAAARGNYVLFTDFDQATPISEVEKLLPFMGRGYDVAIGSREVKGSRREKEPWYRHLMGRGFNLFVSIFAIRGIRDTQCGFKLFKTPVAQKLFIDLVVYRRHPEKSAYTGAFDVEILYLAQKRGYRIAEVPVHWQHIHTTRVHPLKDSFRMFTDLVRIRLAAVLGRYRRLS